MPSIDHALIELLPHLRAFARFLAGNRHDADDLVQDTAVRLLNAADKFVPGTNFRAWAFTVLRNRFFNEFVAKRRKTHSLDDLDTDFASISPTQMDGIEAGELMREFMKLPADARSVLALAAGENMSYEEIAEISGCAVGTVKSRTHRARKTLEKRLKTAYGQAEPRVTPNSAGSVQRAAGMRHAFQGVGAVARGSMLAA